MPGSLLDVLLDYLLDVLEDSGFNENDLSMCAWAYMFLQVDAIA